MEDWVLFENRKGLADLVSGLFFQHPVNEVICWDPAQLGACLQALDELKQQGYYLAGFISYEAGYPLHALPLKKEEVGAVFPLLHFLVFETVERLTAFDVESRLRALAASDSLEPQIARLHLNLSQEAYHSAFQTIKHAIREGETYQVNLTAKYKFDVQGSPVRLYQQLRDRQKVAYSGLLSFTQYQLLSLSPELFFSKRGDKLCVKPMKGTMPRAADPVIDQKHKDWLSSDLKSRAENIMIVDLLRNDLSVFSMPGSVKTPQLLQVESFETVHQMVSTIESRVDPTISFERMIRALFPCGSITGAPKRRTMEIIHAIESEPRHVYTGAIGYIMPNNDLCFSVGIRTLFLRKGHGELGVGGGIVYGSDVISEYEEMRLKARFFTQLFEVNPS